MLIAFTRAVSPTLADCQLTHFVREPLDVARAAAEHEAYELALAELGATVRHLPSQPELPDAVFVEDTAVVLEEIAVIARPGAPSRQPETRSVEPALAALRPLAHIREPGTLDGGDVLHSGRTLFVGASTRSNTEGIEQLRAAVAPHGYEVVAVAFEGCLHLKTAATRIADGLLLVNTAWVPEQRFPDHRFIHVDPDEPNAANALSLGGSLVHPRQFPRTRKRLEAEGFRVIPVDITELAKAEAGVTCCSLLVRDRRVAQRRHAAALAEEVAS